MKCLLLFASLLCATGHAAVVIPIDLEKGNPIADARINGVAVRLVIDSGGGPVSLKPTIVEKVAATRAGSTEGTDILGNTSAQAVLSLEKFEIGGQTFADVEGGEAGAYATSGSLADGIVGRKFLNQFLTIYDYQSQRITLFTQKERHQFARACHGTAIHAISDPDDIVVSTAIIDNGTMRMIWDTGATYSFVKKTVADERKLHLEEVFYTSQTFKLGAKDFGPLKFVVIDAKAPANVDGFVGYNFFLTHVVCIDPFEHVVKIRGADRRARDEAARYCSAEEGWRFLADAPRNGSALLALPIKDGTAEGALLEPGEKVGRHIHWYRRGETELAACSHLDVRDPCGSSARWIEFSRFAGAWSVQGELLETVCTADYRVR